MWSPRLEFVMSEWAIAVHPRCWLAVSVAGVLLLGCSQGVCREMAPQIEVLASGTAGSPREVADLCTNVLEHCPELYDIWVLRGLAHKRLGRLELSVEDFSFALDLKVDGSAKYGVLASDGAGIADSVAWDYWRRGRVLADLGRNREALADLRLAWESGPLTPKLNRELEAMIQEISSLVETESK